MSRNYCKLFTLAFDLVERLACSKLLIGLGQLLRDHIAHHQCRPELQYTTLQSQSCRSSSTLTSVRDMLHLAINFLVVVSNGCNCASVVFTKSAYHNAFFIIQPGCNASNTCKHRYCRGGDTDCRVQQFIGVSSHIQVNKLEEKCELNKKAVPYLLLISSSHYGCGGGDVVLRLNTSANRLTPSSNASENHTEP